MLLAVCITITGVRFPRGWYTQLRLHCALPQGLMGPPSQASRGPRQLGDDDDGDQEEMSGHLTREPFLMASMPSPPPIPGHNMAMVPPMASPMPPTSAGAQCMTPATAGNAPATTTGGYLQVRLGVGWGDEGWLRLVHAV